jgi:hypothetical protein
VIGRFSNGQTSLEVIFMKGLSREARLSAVRELRKALAKKMKHELEESPEMKEKEAMAGDYEEDDQKGPKVSVHISTGKEVNRAIDKVQAEEEVDPEDKPINDEIRESLKKFMSDERIIKPKGVAKTVYGAPKIAENKPIMMVEEIIESKIKKPGRPKRK